jgi:EAL domain-containing protein (putative c-di-GMP-specific phosphodiesterase class I)
VTYNVEKRMEPLELELDELDEADAAEPSTKPSPDPATAFAAGTQQPAAQAVARAAPPPLATGTNEVNLSTLADLEARLDRCIAGLQMHFQPIVYPDRARFGYEALLRSTDKSLPHPGAILDAAERLERTPRLGMAIRTQVAKVFAAAPPDRGVVFVNLHINDLFDRSLTSPFSPLSRIASRVVLEITERASLDGVGDIRYRLAELRERGFRIAIDDLGGGHARMSAMGPLDTDFVKLDMSLVRAVDTHPMKQRLVRSITQLCREHGVMVVGEGVETEAEAECLTELGCDLLQGYLIARPGPPFVDP